MNKEQEALLELIKQSQFGISEQISFDKIDMELLYDEALSQSVLGLVAAEIPVDLINDKWKKAQYRQKSRHILYCHAQDELKNLLDNAGIPFVILKGNAAAVYYNDPSQRMMGDIDFLVPKDLYERAKTVLISSGYMELKDNGRHTGFRRDKITFELHHHFSHEIDIESYLIDGIRCRSFSYIDDHIFPVLPRLANGLVLLDHLRNHLKASIGIRQVVDWMMYVYRNLDDEYWNNEFKFVAEEKGMDTLAIAITRMCQIYLGLPDDIMWCKSANLSTCEQLMELLLMSGNFGRRNGDGLAVELIRTNIVKVGLFRWLQITGESKWEAYQKYHWLKPLCWFYQICRYIIQYFKSGRKKNLLSEDFERSKKRILLLSELKIN